MKLSYAYTLPLLLVLHAALVLPSCSKGSRMDDPERRKTAIFDLENRILTPDTWNPFLPSQNTSQGFLQALCEPLFILNYETGVIEPWLGLEMTSSPEMDVWTLRLRPGVTWSDGEDFGADDVVFTVRMLLANAPSLMFSSALKNWVDRVEKVDDLTVRFVLQRPNPRFQLDYWSVKMFNSVAILPEHIWRDKNPLTFKNYDPGKGWPVFTGPYTLDSMSETEFVYVRDPEWWGARTGWKPLPAPEKLIWASYGSEEMRTAAMAEDALDCLCDISLGAFQALGRRKASVFAWKDALPYAWLDPCSRVLEINNKVPPWDDKEMRWALNYAIDRDVIVAVAYEGTSVPSRHFFPAYPPLERYVDLLEARGLFERYPILKHDPELTKQILESKGYSLNKRNYYEKDGEVLSLTITTHEAYIEKQRIAQVIVEQLQAVGINATHRTEAAGTWTENFYWGRFEAQMGWESCGSINEPWSSMDTFSGNWMVPIGERTQYNGWRWKNDAYTELVREIGSLPLGDPRIDDLFVQAMEIWLDELPIIPVTQAKKLLPFDETYWTGWPSSENNYLHPPTWWQSTHKIIHRLKPAQPPS